MAETGPITCEEAELRQSRQDRAYLKACEEHGIEAVPANYRARRSSFANDATDEAFFHHHQSTLDGHGSTCDPDDIDKRLGWSEPDAEDDCDVSLELNPDAERVLDWVLDLAICDSARISAQAIGTKIVALAWLLERGAIGAKSQTEIADRLEMTRSNFSSCVRGIQKALGGRLRARGQKTEVSNQHYREARLRVVAAGHGNLKSKRKLGTNGDKFSS
jgi:hypothetical protein